ncbi:MAG TPA: hypothetical protein VLW85_00250 [Myxococcales bacterium]|nr:hypothetical protein [Myxococcales bacterium]
MSRHLLCALLLTAACHRQTGPDAHYQHASAAFQALYAAQLDDAYGDPKIDPIVAELKQVDARSIDAQAAATLLDNIARGRAALAKERAEREKMGAVAAQNIATPPVSIDPVKVLAADEPDAGPPQDAYGTNGDVATINAQTGGCLTDYEPFTEQITGKSGTVYRVVNTEGCKARLPGFVGQAVLVISGKIYRRIPDPNPPRPPPPPAPPDAGPPDAGQAAQRRPAAPPPDAGEPEYEMVIPGAPQPGAQPPPAEQQQQ